MTQLLQKAFTEAAKLTDKEQDAFAGLLLEELASEKRWEKAFSSTEYQLAEMAKTALREFKAGETRSMNIDRDFTHD